MSDAGFEILCRRGVRRMDALENPARALAQLVRPLNCVIAAMSAAAPRNCADAKRVYEPVLLYLTQGIAPLEAKLRSVRTAWTRHLELALLRSRMILSQRVCALDRRGLLKAALSGALASPLLACSENAATGRRQFVVVTDDMLAQLSAQSWADILANVPRSDDRGAQRMLQRIGSAVADAAALTDVAWEFVVFDSPEINAFVLPGGKVGCYRGLMDVAAGAGELAAVIGHEVGHVMGRHAAERVSQQLAVQLVSQAAAMMLSEDLGENADVAGAALGAGLVYGLVLPYSRAHELEADRLGVGLMRSAGYEPRDAVTFWERMIALQERPAALAWMSTHPANDDRLAALRALV